MVPKMEKLEQSMVKLTIEIDAAEFESALEKSYQKNKARFAVQGFRRGKAPRSMIVRTYGESVLYEDAINFACPPAYSSAVEFFAIDPVDRPEIDVQEIGSGQNFVFTATVAVMPEATLGKYKGIAADKKLVLVTEEEVEQELSRVQKRNSRLITVEDRGIILGDTAIIDYEGFVDGLAFDGGHGHDHSLQIGSGSFIPGFEEQLVGAAAGQDVDVSVSFPEEYHSKELAGKPAQFKVTVKEVKSSESPDLDDEFAKDVSEFETLAEYKEDIRSKLTKEAREKADSEFENKVIDAAISEMTVEIPEVMITSRAKALVRQMASQLAQQGMKLEMYLAYMGMTEAQLQESMRERAKGLVKTTILLNSVIKAEGIKATDAMIDEELLEYSGKSGQTLESIREKLSAEDLEQIGEDVCRKAAMKLIIDSAETI